MKDRLPVPALLVLALILSAAIPMILHACRKEPGDSAQQWSEEPIDLASKSFDEKAPSLDLALWLEMHGDRAVCSVKASDFALPDFELPRQSKEFLRTLNRLSTGRPPPFTAAVGKRENVPEPVLEGVIRVLLKCRVDRIWIEELPPPLSPSEGKWMMAHVTEVLRPAPEEEPIEVEVAEEEVEESVDKEPLKKKRWLLNIRLFLKNTKCFWSMDGQAAQPLKDATTLIPRLIAERTEGRPVTSLAAIRIVPRPEVLYKHLAAIVVASRSKQAIPIDLRWPENRQER